MKNGYILVVCLTMTAVTGQNCGIPRKMERIVKGVNVERNDVLPFLGSLISSDQFTDEDSLIFPCYPSCTGFMVTTKMFMSAAHCIYDLCERDKWKDQYKVVLSLWNRCDFHNGFTVHDVIDVHVYDGYSNVTHVNDVALFEISPRAGVIPCCLLEDDCLKDSTLSMIIMGFGLNASAEYGGVQPCIINTATISTCTQEEVEKSELYPVIKENSDALLAGCSDDGKDSCQGDSGGPLMLLTRDNRYVCVATTSYGDECGKGGLYSCISDSQDKVNWIKQKCRASAINKEKKEEAEEGT